MSLTQRGDSATSSRWLRQARRLAAGIRQRYQVVRKIWDGCILEGRRAGTVRIATAIDPPTAVMLVGFGMIPPEEEGSAGDLQINPVCIPTSRDNLHWGWHAEELPTDRPAMRRMYAGLRGALALRDETEAWITPRYNAFDHAAVEYPGGFWTHGISTTNPMRVGSQDVVLWYRSPSYPVFYGFSFFCIYGFPNAAIADQSLILRYSQRSNFGLYVDSEWVEDYAGGQVVMDWPGTDTPNSRWGEDSVGYRWQTPWCYASLVGFETVIIEDAERVVSVWQAVARITDAPLSDTDFWGPRRLVCFRVTVLPDLDPNIQPVATAAEGPSYYDPRDSADPTRVPEFVVEGGYFRRNTFCAPAVGPRGAMVVGQVVQLEDPVEGMVDHYHNVLITTAGEFVELPLESDTPRSKCWFVGGDDVDGTVYMLNPFMDGGMVVVNAETGDTTVVPTPGWYPPLYLDNDEFEFEDHLRNMVTHLGRGVLAFPVADSSGINISMATFDTNTGEVEIVGPMWSAPFAAQRGGVSRIGVVQHAVGVPAEDDYKPAILLAGYHNGVDGHGATYISYDDGETWQLFNSQYGPSRGVAAMGNGLYPPRSGYLWEPPDGSDL